MIKLLKCSLLILLTTLISCNTPKKGDNYTTLYNGSDLSEWTLMCRGDDPGLPKMVFTPGENGELHVFKDIPDSTALNEGKNDTHCMIFTKKSYSKYSFKFEYKWGNKIYNNFEKYQYDAGVYYHTFEEKIWPRGIEYDPRNGGGLQDGSITSIQGDGMKSLGKAPNNPDKDWVVLVRRNYN